jgi:hypothetical protein
MFGQARQQTERDLRKLLWKRTEKLLGRRANLVSYALPGDLVRRNARLFWTR